MPKTLPQSYSEMCPTSPMISADDAPLHPTIKKLRKSNIKHHQNKSHITSTKQHEL